MSIQISKQGDTVTIKLDGKFDFDSVQPFRDAYSSHNDCRSFVIDFRDTDYMDSSGLGMLINMRRDLGEEQSSIKLVNCRPQIKKVLLISRFEKYFEIS